MARFKIIADGRAHLYDILEDALTAGSAPGNAIRLEEPGVAEVHARVWRDRDAVWVSPVAGARLTIDGKPVTQHRLRHGDRVALTPQLALEFLDPGSAKREARPTQPVVRERRDPPADLVVPSIGREASQRRVAQARREGRRRPPAKAGPRWHLFSGLLLLSAAVIWISLRVLEGSIGGKSAEDLLALAETQLVRGNPQQAQQTAKSAAARAEGNADLQRRIAAFEARLEQATRAAADSALLENARKALENLKAFERIYLAPSPTSRPECREFVRIADDWREQYAAVCERHNETAGLVAEVAAMRARYAGAAKLDEQDDVEDVLFAARRATRLRRPRYRDAVRILDEFVARGGDPAAVERARAYRAEIVEDGRAWLDQKLVQLQREFERGRSDAVLSEVETLLSESILDDWRADLEAQARVWRQAAGR
ncbi:MAG: FHA domain-containing protein [Planctomycetota bacterium]